MKKILKMSAMAALFFCLAACAFANPDLDREIAAQQRMNEELEKKIQQYNETVKRKSQQAQSLLTRLTDLRQNSQTAQQQMKLLELQSNKLQRSLSALDVEMDQISNQVGELADELRSRVINIYKYGSREELNLLLSAQDAHEAVASAYLLERLARHDRIIIEALLNKAVELRRGKRNIEQNRALLMTQTEELNSQREKYDTVINQTSALLSGVQRERQKAEASAKETERAQLEIGRVLTELMRRKRERLQDSPNSPNTQPVVTTGVSTGITVPVQAYPTLGRGSLLDWPIKGTITSPYGPKVHPEFKTKSFNSGIDINASSGTPVKAAGPGEVLYEGWLRGFGQVVIIDHGRSISTVYAHLGSTRVKERDSVQPGTVIGTVGNTGTAEGYNLHFEVRVGDAAKNPLDYLKKT